MWATAACVAVLAVLLMGVIAMQGKEQRSGSVVLTADKPVDQEFDQSTSRIRGEGQSDTSPDGQFVGSGAVRNGGSRQIPDPPTETPSGWVLVSHASSEGTSRWRYRVTSTAEEAALNLLPLLEKSGAGMVESGYLDISGNAWGCVCSLPDDAGALIVTLLPCNYAFVDGGLEATIVMHEVPDREDGAQ